MQDVFKLRRAIAFILVVIFIFGAFPLPAHGWNWPWSKEDTKNVDVRFSTIYPKSFLQSTVGKVTLYAGSIILVGAITYFTAGTGTAAAAGPIATYIGGTIGGLTGLSGIAAVNAGLAFLGGGSIASGGLGILGGITMLNVVGDFALSVALHKLWSAMPKNSSLEMIKLRMFYDKVSPVAREDLKDLRKALAGEEADLEKVDFFLKRVGKKLTEEVSKASDAATAYNYLLLAIIQYNHLDLLSCRNSVNKARQFVDPKRSSLLDYIEALLDLGEGKKAKSVELLFKITLQEPEAIPPYIILAQIDQDNKRYKNAFETLKRGLSESDKKDCTMNWMAGNCLYEMKEYEKAIPYYRAALANMTINEMEAMYKLNIAKCYKKLGDGQNGTKWLEDAIGEVRKNKTMVAELRREYGKD
ncbi:MAG: tetratricopeptide repeat protein [Synergistaceae bacterium]|nr:tetratricopeptide repeat protein [Synergistaceae bacterium]